MLPTRAAPERLVKASPPTIAENALTRFRYNKNNNGDIP